jgi:hypothetical protein
MSDKTEPKKVCFVIGPIGDPKTEPRRHADWLFQGIIKPVFVEHFHDEFEVPVRADQIVAPGSINTQVIQKLLEAPLVIADLSLHNANAFYELAIRHAIRLPTIHMIHKDWKLPFDVAAFRAISFSRDDYEDLERARTSLKSTVEEVMKPGFEVENPITHARGVINIDQHASPEQRVLLDRLEALERQVQELGRTERTMWATRLVDLMDLAPISGEGRLTYLNEEAQQKYLNEARLRYLNRKAAQDFQKDFQVTKPSE